MNIKFFFPYGIGIIIASLAIGLVYAAVQQTYRASANDPQVQLAYEMNHQLQQGRSIDKLFPDSIDLAQSLGTFAVVYDSHYRPIRSSALLDGKYPQLPTGVFEHVKAHGEERVTWQPRTGVRMAMVVLETASPSTGFIALGRSLKEIELRESALGRMTFICWLTAMGLIFVVGLVQYYYSKKSNI
jgi:hypothetical protein